MTAYLFGAGRLPEIPPAIEKDSLIIAVDGGYSFLEKSGIKPHAIIGDFDSFDSRLSLPRETEIITLNPIKDVTDMAAAAEAAVTKGAVRLLIYGGTGGRSGHLLANISLLLDIAKKGMEAWLISDKEEITVIHNGWITFSADTRGYLSVFSLSEKSFGVYERGLKYSLTDYTMESGDAIGVSNEFVGKESAVSVKKGSLLIIKEWE